MPFTESAIAIYLPKLKNMWNVVDGKKLHSIFIFKDFKQSMKFVDKIAKIAEKEGHHPDMTINYNKVVIELTTHAIGGLSENDFIVAAKIEIVATKI